MFLELESLFNTPGMDLPFAYTLPEQPAEQEGEGLPLTERPKIEGVLRNRTDVVSMDAVALLRLAAHCDRCAAPIAPEMRIALQHTLVRSLNDETNDELILLEQPRWSPDALIWEDIVLAMPSKLLCRPNCRGVCPDCGQNRNEGICSCGNAVDPRLAGLRDWLKSEDNAET